MKMGTTMKDLKDFTLKSVLKHHSPFPCLHKRIHQESSLRLLSRQMFFVKRTCQTYIKLIVEINGWVTQFLFCYLANFNYLVVHGLLRSAPYLFKDGVVVQSFSQILT